jgi:hypothetical protein
MLAVAALALLALAAPAARAAPVLDAEGIAVRYEPRDRGRAEQALRTVPGIADEVARRLGVAPPRPLLVVLAEGDAQLDRAVEELTRGRGRAPPWALAVAIPGAGAVVVRARRLEVLSWNDLRPTLAHELAHLALASGSGRMPRFLDEGLAMWAEGRRLSRAERTSLERRARGGDLPALADLEAGFPAHAEEAHAAYLQSLGFVEWLEAAAGPEGIAAFVRRVDAGEPWEAAFERAFDAPLRGAEIAFAAELARSYSLARDVWESASILTLAAVLVVIAFVRWRRKRPALMASLDRLPSEAEASPSDLDGSPSPGSGGEMK